MSVLPPSIEKSNGAAVPKVGSSGVSPSSIAAKAKSEIVTSPAETVVVPSKESIIKLID